MTGALTQLVGPMTWNVLARIERAGQPVNCAILRGVCDADLADLTEMESAGLLVIRQPGRDTAPPEWLTSAHQLEARLTDRGHALARTIVELAGVLLWLSRRRNGMASIALMQQSTAITGDLLDLLFAHVLIEPVDADGRPVARSIAGCGRITRRGRSYTTENPS